MRKQMTPHAMLTFCLFSTLFSPVFCVFLRGTWNPSQNDAPNFKIIARFGFQRTDPLRLDETRGYIFGNISGGDGEFSTLALLNFAHFREIYQILKDSSEFSCQKTLILLKNLAFDAKCNKNGQQDVFRRLPCPQSGLCPDEDQPSNVFPNFQFTYRIQDKSQARFWYLLLLDCKLDQNCLWQKSNFSGALHFEIFAVNGHPQSKSWWKNFLFLLDDSQLSIDERYLPKISFFGLIFSTILLILSLKNSRYLAIVLLLAICRHFLILTHYFALSNDGVGMLNLKFLGDQILDQSIEYLLIFLLILIAKGWKIQTLNVKKRKESLALIGGLFTLHWALCFWALFTRDPWLYTCIFDVWQGWAILLVRLLATCWFFFELRSSVKSERDEQKRTFLLHFGSGFLVWFVYLPILGAFSINISMVNRLEIVEGLHHLANFVVCATLTHLFYPKSSSRRIFADYSRNDSMSLEEDIFDDEEEKFDYTTVMEDLDNVKTVIDCSK